MPSLTSAGVGEFRAGGCEPAHIPNGSSLPGTSQERIDDSYNDYVAALSEHIEADFERALKRLEQAQKLARQ